MIKCSLLYKATPRGSKARSSGRRCREEGETETESGTGTGTGVGRESRIVEQNPICETERETERGPETGTVNGDRNCSCEREAVENTAQEAEENTAREGDKDPSLTKRVVFQNTGCGVPTYSRGLRWPLYTQDRLTTRISIPVPPSSRSIHSTRTPPRYPQSVPL